MKALQILSELKMNAMKEFVRTSDAALALYEAATPPDLASGDLLNTAIKVADTAPVLVVPDQDAPSADSQNAVLVHEYLRGLTRTQAADFRLWTTLSHSVFWEYVRARWGKAKNPRQTVLEHWFVGKGGKAGLRTQAISRLWWAAHLTYAPWETDPELRVFETADKYRYTHVLLRNQQIYFDLVERDFGSDLRLRACILDAYRRHQATGWRDEISREASKLFNLLVRHRQLSNLPIGELQKACDAVIDDVAARTAPGKSPASTAVTSAPSTTTVPPPATP